MIKSSFNIYDASAGSGKTFTLVKEYLKILFSSSFNESYRNILALTFTNKAVGEMKSRIIETLMHFSDHRIIENPTSIFNAICNELPISPESLHKKAGVVLNHLIHNYASFEVSTIDKFTQRVIRTFAHDLNLSQNFEVELDTDRLLMKAVDNLIAKAGSDQRLTKTLVEFAVQKTDEDKSWDVSYDLNNIAKLLVNENDISFVKQLESKKLNDFELFKQDLNKQMSTLKNSIVNHGEIALKLIEDHQIDHNSFSGKNGFLPSYFKKITEEDFNITFDKVWMSKLNTHPLYPSTTAPLSAEKIDTIQPMLVAQFNASKHHIIEWGFIQNILKNITPLSVLTLISKELTSLKEDQNLMLISEFNNIISNHIKEQPAPFIYERLGEKFRHYFIDEFQDTSILQWENLVPLIANALSGENASTLLVGDAKQAIYRWRGGKAEQFIGLYNNDNPFFIDKNINKLPINYRSTKNIVNFNNNFFKHLASFAFSNNSYAQLYKSSHQDTFLDANGYVNISFLEFIKDDDKDILYAQHVHKIINNCLLNGYTLGDMCILVRRKSEGMALAKFLSDAGVNIVSSETLLIDSSEEVRFIVSFLEYVANPENILQKLKVLNYVGKTLLGLNDMHEFLAYHVDKSVDALFELFNSLGFGINLEEITQNSLTEGIAAIIYRFNLNKHSNAYLQFFLDFALDFSAHQNVNLTTFLEYYQQKKETISIVSPEATNAVRIMTIHKSKGLEFPVVIFPYADLDIYREKSPKIWFHLNPDKFNDFPVAYLNYNKNIHDFSEEGAKLYQQRQAELELDNINLMYVAFTRPIEQLYIVSNKRVDKKGNENLRYYSGLLINYLKHTGLWVDTKLEYSIGNAQRELDGKTEKQITMQQASFISTPKEHHKIQMVTNSGFLWDTQQKDAIEKGNLIHDIMAQIKTSQDVTIALDDFITQGKITSEQAATLKPSIMQIVSHPDLRDFFSTKNTIYNEREIITPQGEILRPDRIIINQHHEAVIIDYKTGAPNKTYETQLYTYASAIEKMNIKVVKKILIYINGDLKIKEV